MRGPPDECQPRSFAPRFGLDSGRYAPCVQPETPAGHQRENIGAASDVSPKSVQFSVAKSVQFSVAIDSSAIAPIPGWRPKKLDDDTWGAAFHGGARALQAQLGGARIIVKTADGATWPTTVREVDRRARSRPPFR